jgi:hypothetical protein
MVVWKCLSSIGILNMMGWERLSTNAILKYDEMGMFIY